MALFNVTLFVSLHSTLSGITIFKKLCCVLVWLLLHRGRQRSAESIVSGQVRVWATCREKNSSVSVTWWRVEGSDSQEWRVLTGISTWVSSSTVACSAQTKKQTPSRVPGKKQQITKGGIDLKTRRPTFFHLGWGLAIVFCIFYK